MTAPRDPDSIIASWLEEGPTGLPDQTRRAIAVTTRSTEQKRRSTWASWRIPPMTSVARFAAAAIAVIAVAGGAIYFTQPGGRVGGPPSSPSPSVVATPSSGAQGTVPTDWTAYNSSRFAYSIEHPSDWVVAAATADWPTTGIPYPDGVTVDKFLPTPNSTTWVFVASVPVSAGDPAAARLAEMDSINAQSCQVSNRHDVTVDGATARQEDTFCFEKDHLIETYVSDDARFYQIVLFSAAPIDATTRATFGRFVSSFRFVAPPATTTYTSPSYGYTVDHLANFTVEPATADWPIGVKIVVESEFLDRYFSPLPPNGSPSYLGIGSQAIPATMTPDAWFTAHKEANSQVNGGDCSAAPAGWTSTTLAGDPALRLEAICGGYPVTEIILVRDGRGWIVTGDTAVVEHALRSLQLP